MNEQKVTKAFRLYAQLESEGKLSYEEGAAYFQDDEIRGILSEFVKEVDCTLIADGTSLYLVPLSSRSKFHMSNEQIKKDYMPSRALNIDIYLMYVAMIIFMGEFYDSYQRTSPTREFLHMDDWIHRLSERFESLKRLGEDVLKEKEEEFDYQWVDIIHNWDSMDTIKEGIRRQTARTASRLSFMLITAGFMIDQGLIRETGEREYALTDKGKGIVEGYYMDYTYNRGVLEFIYQCEQEA